MNIQVIDDDGQFFRNTCEYPVYHHQRDKVLLSGMTYQINADKWLESQPAIEKLDNPLKSTKAKAPAKD